MPLQDNFDANSKIKNEQIDFDFYDSTESTCDEIVGVKKVEIKESIPNVACNSNMVTEASCTSNVNTEEDSGMISILINNSDCDLEDGLTKCIAYETNTDDCDSFDASCSGLSDSPILGSSLSHSTSSTPSDFTNITPLTSSNSFSSLNKEKLDDTCTVSEESPKPDMKLLSDAVKTLSLQNKPKRRSSIPVSTSSRQLPSKPRRKNMTFTNDEVRKINRENEILLKKIMAYNKPRAKSNTFTANTPPRSIKSSAAVNRSKKQREINHNNYILFKKIHNAKASQSYFNT